MIPCRAYAQNKNIQDQKYVENNNFSKADWGKRIQNELKTKKNFEACEPVLGKKSTTQGGDDNLSQSASLPQPQQKNVEPQMKTFSGSSFYSYCLLYILLYHMSGVCFIILCTRALILLTETDDESCFSKPNKVRSIKTPQNMVKYG